MKKEPLIWTPDQLEGQFSWDHLHGVEIHRSTSGFRSLKEYQEAKMKLLPTHKAARTRPQLANDAGSKEDK